MHVLRAFAGAFPQIAYRLTCSYKNSRDVPTHLLRRYLIFLVSVGSDMNWETNQISEVLEHV